MCKENDDGNGALFESYRALNERARFIPQQRLNYFKAFTLLNAALPIAGLLATQQNEALAQTHNWVLILAGSACFFGVGINLIWIFIIKNLQDWIVITYAQLYLLEAEIIPSCKIHLGAARVLVDYKFPKTGTILANHIERMSERNEQKQTPEYKDALSAAKKSTLTNSAFSNYEKIVAWLMLAFYGVGLLIIFSIGICRLAS